MDEDITRKNSRSTSSQGADEADRCDEFHFDAPLITATRAPYFSEPVD